MLFLWFLDYRQICWERLAGVCIDIAQSFLYFNFIALSFLGLVLAYTAYPTRLPWILGLLGLFFLLLLIGKARLSKRKPLKYDFKKAIKSGLSPFLMVILFFAITWILLGVNEQGTIPSFAIGCIAIILWSILRFRKKEQKQV